MTILVSPAEPAPFKDLGPSTLLTESYGADFLIPMHGDALIAVQRKEFPSDFLASLYDGRIARLAVEITGADLRMLLLEGTPVWTNEGALRLNHGGFGRQFTRSQLEGLLWSLHWQFGVATYWTSSKAETVSFLTHLAEWAAKPTHPSLQSRPTLPDRGFGRKPSTSDRQSWILQGFPGIGPTVAEQVVSHHGGLPFQWSATRKEMLDTPGIGPGRLESMEEIVPREET